jgi:hypothetical protein
VLATVSASRTSALIAQRRPAAVALTDGHHLAFSIAFGLVAAAIAVAATVLRPQSQAEVTQQPARESVRQQGEDDRLPA